MSSNPDPPEKTVLAQKKVKFELRQPKSIPKAKTKKVTKYTFNKITIIR